ncbi:hypothetical protein ACOME3_008455 [Neoechinorhynchus agilis]
MNMLVLITFALLVEVQRFELILSQVICRHAARHPLMHVPDEDDGNFNVDNKSKIGRLTEIGVKQAYQVGEYLRKLYVKTQFLCGHYEPKQVSVFSTNFSRTIETTKAVMSSLFEFNQNVPYSTFEFDCGVNWSLKCPAYNKFRDALDQETFAEDGILNHTVLNVLDLLGRKVNKSITMEVLYDLEDMLSIW